MRSLTDFATWRWNVVETFFNLLSFMINIPAIMCYLGDSFDNWWLRCTICTSYESTENMQHKYNEAVKSPACFFFSVCFYCPFPSVGYYIATLTCIWNCVLMLCYVVILLTKPIINGNTVPEGVAGNLWNNIHVCLIFFCVSDWGTKKYGHEPNGLGIWLPVGTHTRALRQ